MARVPAAAYLVKEEQPGLRISLMCPFTFGRLRHYRTSQIVNRKQLSQADLTPLMGMGGAKSMASNKTHTIGGVHHQGKMHRKSSLMLLTHTHHTPAKHGSTLKCGSLIIRNGSITSSGSQVMMASEDLMRSAHRLHQEKIDKEIHDMHFYISAKVATQAAERKHRSVVATRRNAIVCETLALRGISNALDPEEQVTANSFRSKLENFMHEP